MPHGTIQLSLDDRRLIGDWVADCAERVLGLFEAKAPSDDRPRKAIDGIRLFAQGGKRTVQLRSVALAALAAAREVGDPAASAAARSAGIAASSAYTKAIATIDHAKHALGPAVYAALARELSNNNAPRAGLAELDWAIAHASKQVKAIISRWPPRTPGNTRLSTLFHYLDNGLRQ